MPCRPFRDDWISLQLTDETPDLDEATLDTLGLLEDENVLHEWRNQSPHLEAYFEDPRHMSELISIALDTDAQVPDTTAELAARIITTHPSTLTRLAGSKTPNYLDIFFQLLTRDPPLSKISSSSFAQIIHQITLHARPQVYAYLDNHLEYIAHLIRHLGADPIHDLVAFLLRSEIAREAAGEAPPYWITASHIPIRICRLLLPATDPLTRENALYMLSDLLCELLPGLFNLFVTEASVSCPTDLDAQVNFGIFLYAYGPRQPQQPFMLAQVVEPRFVYNLLCHSIWAPEVGSSSASMLNIFCELLRITISPYYVRCDPKYIPFPVRMALRTLDDLVTILRSALKKEPGAPDTLAPGGSPGGGKAGLPAPSKAEQPATDAEAGAGESLPSSTTPSGPSGAAGSGASASDVDGTLPHFGTLRVAILYILSMLLATNYHFVEVEIQKSEIIKTMLDLFFQYTWNGVMHGAAVDILRYILHHEVCYIEITSLIENKSLAIPTVARQVLEKETVASGDAKAEGAAKTARGAAELGEASAKATTKAAQGALAGPSEPQSPATSALDDAAPPGSPDEAPHTPGMETSYSTASFELSLDSDGDEFEASGNPRTRALRVQTTLSRRALAADGSEATAMRLLGQFRRYFPCFPVAEFNIFLLPGILPPLPPPLCYELFHKHRLHERIVARWHASKARIGPHSPRECIMAHLSSLASLIEDVAERSTRIRSLLAETDAWGRFITEEIKPLQEVEREFLAGPPPLAAQV